MQCLSDIIASLDGIRDAILNQPTTGNYTTWSPVLQRGTTPVGLSTQYALYRAILTPDGEKYSVEVIARLVALGASGDVGNWLVTNLPHSVDLGGSKSTLCGHFIIWDASTSFFYTGALVAIGGNNIQFQTSGSNARVGVGPAIDIEASDEIAISMFYKADVL